MKMRRRVQGLSTGVLRGMERWLDTLPLWLMGALRSAIKEELLARDLPLIADESGGHPCVAPMGVQ